MSTESTFPPASLRPILKDIYDLLEKSHKEQGGKPPTIAVAETSTGGLISAAFLSVPGASKWYAGGATLYTRESRLVWGGWTEEHLKDYRGPTPEIAANLAAHVCSDLGATYCIGESGTAGPTVPGAPYIHSIAGQVSLAVASHDGKVVTKLADTGLGTDREGNMVKFAELALGLLRDVLSGEAKLEEKNEKEDGASRL